MGVPSVYSKPWPPPCSGAPPMSMQQTSVYGGTTSCHNRLGRQNVLFSFIVLFSFRCRQGFLLDHSGMQGGSSWITFESIVLRSMHKDLSLFSGNGNGGYSYSNSTFILCSFIYEDVGKPTDFAYEGMLQDHHLHALLGFEPYGTSMSEICFAMTSRSSTERLGDFLKA